MWLSEVAGFGYYHRVEKFIGRISGIRAYAAALAGVAAVTAGLTLFHVHTNATTVALILLLVVLIVATAFGSRPALFASLLGLVSFNFFFLPPFYTLSISATENWVAFAAFLVTALVAGQLSSYARRRADESEQRRREIERLYDELQNAFDKASQAEALRQSEQLKSALLDAVTHDLRTPLTSIKASVTTLLEEGADTPDEGIVLDTESRKELLDVINEETDRLNDFVGGIVDLARVEAGKHTFRRSETELAELVAEAVDRARPRIGRRVVETDLEFAPRTVEVDASSLAEVLYTLIDNAAKYSPDDSRIRITAALNADNALEISVEDQGKGIPDELRGKVFEKFYRASEGSIHSTASGLGLGLAIARGIVESQGGKIWVEDGRDGFVTRLVFGIPIGSDDVSQ